MGWDFHQLHCMKTCGFSLLKTEIPTGTVGISHSTEMPDFHQPCENFSLKDFWGSRSLSLDLFSGTRDEGESKSAGCDCSVGMSAPDLAWSWCQKTLGQPGSCRAGCLLLSASARRRCLSPCVNRKPGCHSEHTLQTARPGHRSCLLTSLFADAPWRQPGLRSKCG